MEPPLSCLSLLVQTLAGVLSPLLDKPFAFFGHSMGALVSFELTRQLRKQHGLEPMHLFISASRAPQLPLTGMPLHTLPDPALLQALRRLNGTPKAVLEHKELMQLMLPLLRADLAVCETYVYTTEPPLNCPISTFGGLQDQRVGRRHLEAWREQTTAAFSLLTLPGDHFFLHTAQSLLLHALSHELSRLVRTIT